MPPLDLNEVPTIAIGIAAKMLGISVSSIRQYEMEGLIVLARGDNGRRLLSGKDIDRIACVKRRIVEEGYNFEGLRRLLALIPCWEMRPCTLEERSNCQAFHDQTTPCWSMQKSVCAQKGYDCRNCRTYWEAPRCSENMKEFLKVNCYSCSAPAIETNSNNQT